jgi:hypothetical protein
VKIVWALTAVHNFLNQNGCDPHEDESGYESEDDSDTDNCTVSYDIGEQAMSKRREDIADAMWEQYQDVLAVRLGCS